MCRNYKGKETTLTERVLFLAIAIMVMSDKGVYADSCPIFGTKQSSPLTRSTRERLYMNFQSPLQCRSNLTGWNFCYYKNDQEDFRRGIISSVFIIFRRYSNTQNYDSVTRKEIVFDNNTIANSSDFVCMTEEIVSKNSITVEPNDIIGVCIKRTHSVSPLYLVGTSNVISQSTYIVDTGWTRFCTQERVYFSPATRLDNSILHLYADIAVADMCRVGQSFPPSIPLIEELSGTYLNTQYPVPSCGNYITKWHYCYYTETVTPGSTLSMTVAVWSLDTETNTYIVSPSSIRNITLQHVLTLAKIFCAETSLVECEYINVSSGDVIGMVLPSQNAIPIVSFNEDDINKFVMRSLSMMNPSNYTQSNLIRQNGINLHFYATLAGDVKNIPVHTSTIDYSVSGERPIPDIVQPTSVRIKNTETNNIQVICNVELCINESETSTRISIQQENLSGGEISSIIISILLVMVVVLVLVVVVILVLIRNSKVPSKCQTGIDQDIVRTEENEAYSTFKSGNNKDHHQKEELPTSSNVAYIALSKNAEIKCNQEKCNSDTYDYI